LNDVRRAGGHDEDEGELVEQQRVGSGGPDLDGQRIERSHLGDRDDVAGDVASRHGARAAQAEHHVVGGERPAIVVLHEGPLV
jgi:hypothetical protein